jgi:peptidoglycan glycosyltransferase
VNKQVRGVGLVLTLMFVALFATATSIQVVRSGELYQNSRNIRASYETYKTLRGDIIIGGVPVVISIPVNDEYRYLRAYENVIYGSITGYFSIFSGSNGIERAMNSYISGQSSAQFFEQINALLDGTPVTGAAVELTIDPVAQRAAWDALGNRKGAVVVMEPATGRILALVSKPTFDANLLASHRFDDVTEAYRDYAEDADRPLVNRAISGDLYHPGSIFKLVVAAAALESGRYTVGSRFENLSEYTLPGTNTAITNSGGGRCGTEDFVSLETALIKSCNIPFAMMAVILGQDRIRAQAELMGFDSPMEIPLTVASSIYPVEMDEAQTALTGFGQFDVRVTPLQMAMVTAAIANQGVVMKPQLISSVVASNLNLLSKPQPVVYTAPISRTTAGFLTRMMVDSVEIGVASKARMEGVAVAGKTGTAQNGPDEPYTLWFTGFAPAEAPRYVITVVVEDGGGVGQNGNGNRIAAPIAKTVLEALLK